MLSNCKKNQVLNNRDASVFKGCNLPILCVCCVSQLGQSKFCMTFYTFPNTANTFNVKDNIFIDVS